MKHIALILCISLVPIATSAQPAPPRHEDTEYYSPVPPVVTPGDAAGASAPSDAIVLFGGSNLDQWVNTRDKAPAGWTVAEGVLTVNKAAGSIETRQKFRNYQLHLEWRIPADIAGADQARGNSGVFLGSTGPGDAGYELQILDCYRNRTYVNGQAGSLYKQSPPLVNPCRKPGEWQTYDIIWTAPVFASDGKSTAPARVTVLFNGVLVQNDFDLKGETLWVGTPSYHVHGRLPIKLQDHGDPSPPISFRTIWIRELSAPKAE